MCINLAIWSNKRFGLDKIGRHLFIWALCNVDFGLVWIVHSLYKMEALNDLSMLYINNITMDLVIPTETLRDWDNFIQHDSILFNMTVCRCMLSDTHDSSHLLFSINLISITTLHVERPLLRPLLVAYAEATLARQQRYPTYEKCWQHVRIIVVDKWSVVWNECKNRSYWQDGKAFDHLQHD